MRALRRWRDAMRRMYGTGPEALPPPDRSVQRNMEIFDRIARDRARSQRQT